jgi:uncharacterized repeat protein (TIGR01451 family)
MSYDRRERDGRISAHTVLLLAIIFVMTTFLQFLVPNVSAQPSITLGMNLSATDVEPGDMVGCTIFFNNTGSNNSSFAWINVTFSMAFVYSSDTSALEGGTKAGNYNWTFPSVMVGIHSFDIFFLVSNKVQDGDLITVSANINYLDQFTTPMPPSNAFVTATARRPVISVTKTAESYIISPDQTYNYTISFQNTGSRNATEVYVYDTLPWSLAYDNDTASSIGGVETSPLNWTFFDVVGALSFNLTVQALFNLTDGTMIDNMLTLYYRNVNGIWSPIEIATNTTTIAVGAPAFTFSKTVNKGTAAPGDSLNYTLSLSNVGTGNAMEVWINDTIPNGTAYSSSTCDSFANNTCTWTLYDFGPGSYEELHLNVSINASVPSGSTIQNTAYLNYTDSKGNPLGNLSSNDTTTVQERYLSLILQDRALTSTPYDTIEFDVLIQNESPQPSLKAWLNVTLPQEIQYVSDNASDVGGIKTGSVQWEFNNILRGNHSFRITTEIVSETVDGDDLQIGILLDHTDVAGASLPTITDGILVTIEAPVFSPEIVSTKRDFQRSENAVVTIYLNNTGSATAVSVWVDLSVPSSVDYLSDTSDSINGVRLRDFEFLINSLDPGDHSFDIQFDVGSIGETKDIEIWLYVNYTDSDGDMIGQSSERISFGVIVTAEEFPYLLLAFVALIAFAMALAFASRRESVKYSLLIFFVPLFSRLKKEQVMDHETRGMIRGYVIANPGDHFNSIKATLDLKNGTLAHHLHILEREKIIKSVKDGKFRRFFPMGMRISENAYPTKIEMLILDIIRETPGITQKDIGSQLGMSQPTVSYHIAKLKKSKRLRAKKHGMSMRLYLEDIEK